MSVPGYKTRSVLATVTPPLTISGKKYSADQKSTSLCSSSSLIIIIMIIILFTINYQAVASPTRNLRIWRDKSRRDSRSRRLKEWPKPWKEPLAGGPWLMIWMSDYAFFCIKLKQRFFWRSVWDMKNPGFGHLCPILNQSSLLQKIGEQTKGSIQAPGKGGESHFVTYNMWQAPASSGFSISSRVG